MAAVWPGDVARQCGCGRPGPKLCYFGLRSLSCESQSVTEQVVLPTQRLTQVSDHRSRVWGSRIAACSSSRVLVSCEETHTGHGKWITFDKYRCITYILKFIIQLDAQLNMIKYSKAVPGGILLINLHCLHRFHPMPFPSMCVTRHSMTHTDHSFLWAVEGVLTT